MKITLMAVGRTSTPYIRQAMADYVARASRYVQFDVEELPDLKNSRSLNADEQKRREGELILKSLKASDRVVLLDERGESTTSMKFAAGLQQLMASGLRRVVYIVGGPYGFSPEVYARADSRLSLSAMTFTHEMVRLFFAEQVYRAMAIIHGLPYHHE